MVMDLNWFKSRRESNMSNVTTDSGYAGSVAGSNGSSSQNDSSFAIQMNGIMQKKPFGHQSTKWSRRFFVLKEGFLLYYAESEKKAFENKKYFNIHPKGVIPLGYCTIEDTVNPGMQYCINIHHPSFKAPICVATDDEESRKEWIRAMDKATKVTMENSDLGETMIKSLQEQSLQLARERQEYVDKFITEAEEHGAERELREALEEFNMELEEENARIETLVEELKSAHVEVKNELLKAIESSKTLEREREEMASKTSELQQNLELLSRERAAIIQKLQHHEARAERPAEQDAELARQLAAIEQKANILEKDKEEIRQRLEENELKSRDILHERELISKEAEDLKCEMEELTAEKKIAEKDLKEEIMARLQLQRELDECKAALQRLETSVLSNIPDKSTPESEADGKSVPSPPDDVQESANEQILKDVKSLREFFENCARENQMENECPMPAPRKSKTAPQTSPVKCEVGSTSAKSKVEGTTNSPTRMSIRASRRIRTADRSKSMYISGESADVVLREPSYRRSVIGMLARQRRSMSLSVGTKGRKRQMPPMSAEVH